ncbi:hypothetical protein IT568_09825 [bacterium]|nr:hypothetical protein [bacterium]
MKLILIFLILFFISCSWGVPKIGNKSITNGSTIEVVEQGAVCHLKYTSHQVLMEEISKEGQIQLQTIEQIKKTQDAVGKGGRILVQTTGFTIPAANPENWLYVVKDLNGNEIMRKNGEYNLPDRLNSQSSLWAGVDVFFIKTSINKPFIVYIISKITNERVAFKIYPNEIVN